MMRLCLNIFVYRYISGQTNLESVIHPDTAMALGSIAKKSQNRTKLLYVFYPSSRTNRMPKFRVSTRKFTLFEGLLYYRQKEFKSVICMYTYLKLLTHTNSKKLSQVDADLVFIFLYIIYYSFTVFCHLLAKKHLETPVYDASALADKLQSPHENISNSYRCKIFFSTDD